MAPFEERARFLVELEAGRPSEHLVARGEYPVAMALWGLGAHRKDKALLNAAAQTLVLATEKERVADTPPPYQLERRALAAWIEHVGDPQKQRPPLPFD